MPIDSARRPTSSSSAQRRLRRLTTTMLGTMLYDGCWSWRRPQLGCLLPRVVVLHRCGNDFYFLIVCTWRNSNEIWQNVLYKDGDAMADFELFPRDGAHKPTLCVWELVPVWHEQQAWERFLTSSRDESAGEAWLRDLFAGPASGRRE